MLSPVQLPPPMELLIQQFIEHLPYLGVVLILAISGFGAPIPEDLPLLLGGYLCGTGRADIWIMLPVTFVAVLGADLMVYSMGRRYGHHVPRLPLLRRYLSESRLAKAELAFHRHGGKTLFIARFMPGMRAPIFFSAGAFKLPFWKMLAFDGSAAVMSVPLWVLASWYLSRTVDFETIQEWSFATQAVLIITVLVCIVAVVGWKLLRRRRLASVG